VTGRVDRGLTSALGLARGEMVAFVGAGGKTTAAWRLLGELADSGVRSIFTSTTHIFKPGGDDVALIVDPGPAAEDLRQAVERAPKVVWAARIGERGEPERARRSPYPAGAAKLVGVASDVLERLSLELPKVTWLVEADGARGRLLKAPAAYEPVIPSGADRVVVVAALDAIGRRLDGDTVHRPEIAARLLGATIGARITPAMLVELVAYPLGGMKGIPAGAEVVVLLTRWDGSAADGEGVAERLLRTGRFARVVEADLRAPDPVVGAWSR
jgi:probable selenium-dependent hydroxylase accessory protein YqeC